jgi:hypothetical protein
VDWWCLFPTMLRELAGHVEVSKNYEKSELLQILRILKNYDLLKDEQLELFRPRQSRKNRRHDRREAYIALNMMTSPGAGAGAETRRRAGLAGGGIHGHGTGPAARPRASGAEVARSILEPAACGGSRGRRGAGAGANTARGMITQDDADYPAALKQIYDPPLALYVRGTLVKEDSTPWPWWARGMPAITDKAWPTSWPINWPAPASRWSAAWRAALIPRPIGGAQGGGRTLAVLGSALDKLYPEENAELADADRGARGGDQRIHDGPGPGSHHVSLSKPDRFRSSMGTIVVEANMKSGAVITATEALEQGRTVFAVPGRVDQPSARGHTC